MTHETNDDAVLEIKDSEFLHQMDKHDDSFEVDTIIDEYKHTHEQTQSEGNDNDENNVTIDNNEENEENEDSDFGAFDDASFDDESFDEFEEPIEDQESIEPTEEHVDILRFTEETFNEKEDFKSSMNELMGKLFPDNLPKKDNKSELRDLLNQRSSEVFKELSAIPHLKPPNWIKMKIRHILLVELGIPINLDEISNDHHTYNHQVKHGSSNINTIEENIDWSKFDIPKDSKLSTTEKKELIKITPDILSAVETDNLTNSTKQYLESCSDDALDAKLAEFNSNYNRLIQIASVWIENFEELKENFKVYENVIQNFIGNSQKLRREEIFENISKLKQKGKKGKKPVRV